MPRGVCDAPAVCEIAQKSWTFSHGPFYSHAKRQVRVLHWLIFELLFGTILYSEELDMYQYLVTFKCISSQPGSHIPQRSIHAGHETMIRF